MRIHQNEVEHIPSGARRNILCKKNIHVYLRIHLDLHVHVHVYIQMVGSFVYKKVV